MQKYGIFVVEKDVDRVYFEIMLLQRLFMMYFE
jgi:hypothetical protein